MNDLGGSERGEGSGKAADDTVALIEAQGGTAVPNYANVAEPRAVRRAGPAGRRHLRQARHPREQRRHRARLRDLEHAGRRLGHGDDGPRARHVVDVALRVEALPRPGQDTATPSTGASSTRRRAPASAATSASPGYATAKAAIVGMTLTVARSSTAPASPSTASARPASPASPPPCRDRARRSSPTRSPRASGTRWTRRTARRSSPGSASDEADHVTGQVIRVHPRQAHLDGRLVRAQGRQLRRQAVGRRQARHDHGHRDLRDPAPGHGSVRLSSEHPSTRTHRRRPPWPCPPTSRSSTA